MKSRHAFSLIEVMVVVVLVGIFAAIAVPSMVGARDQQAIEDGFTQTEVAVNGARDIARAELRCVTVAHGTSPLSTIGAIVGTVHPCSAASPYATTYTNGVPDDAERQIFSIPVDPSVFVSFNILEQSCTPPADCLVVPCHGFGDVVEFRTDGSTDASYVLRLVRTDGTEQLWDVHAATGTVRRRG